ncbi:MAG: LuxR C-terminal-related transcriptional regulator [Sphingobacteriaceae bacterium]|nr:LuxR C-terminal-related transcriptional regulator [Sphingobacteriaceae bacterium]
MTTVNQPILAGLLDNDSIEFFAYGEHHLAMFNGEVTRINELPEQILEAIEAEMLTHPEAMAALIELGKYDRIERIEQWLFCRYGGFDNKPDMVKGVMGEPEYWACPLRGNCPHEFKLCAGIGGPGGLLTHREIDVIKGVVAGESDKQISDSLSISTNTVIVHLRNIRVKLHAQSTKDIAAWAVAMNIATPQIF